MLVDGYNIAEIAALTVEKAEKRLRELSLDEREKQIAAQVIKEIRSRLQFLIDVGLGYLALDRPAATLSGGEAQRIRLATQIGSGLTGVIYILDEPSIGLHLRDSARLLDTLEALRDLGNTVIVVEHDLETILRADHLVDIGPGAGARGGHIVAQGDVASIMSSPASITGDYLSGRRSILPDQRRLPNERWLWVRGRNNLKNIDVGIPSAFVCIRGFWLREEFW